MPHKAKTAASEKLTAPQRELLETYTSVVRKIAGGFRRKVPRNVLIDDLLAAGMSGLWDAVRKHPKGPTDYFPWYVRVRIRGAILDELRTQDWMPRRARARADAEEQTPTGKYCPRPPGIVRFDDLSAFEVERAFFHLANAEATAVASDERVALGEAISMLPERERYIVNRHYFDATKMRAIGVELGVSEPRISQLHSRAMQRLRSTMAKKEDA